MINALEELPKLLVTQKTLLASLQYLIDNHDAVYVPAGIYDLGGGALLNRRSSGLGILGDGPNATVFLGRFKNSDPLVTRRHCSLKRVQFLGDTGIGVSAENFQHFTMEDVVVKGFDTNVYLNGSYYSEISGQCNFSGGGKGLHAVESNSLTVTGGVFNQNGTAIELDTCNGFELVNPNCESNDVGVSLTDCEGIATPRLEMNTVGVYSRGGKPKVNPTHLSSSPYDVDEYCDVPGLLRSFSTSWNGVIADGTLNCSFLKQGGLCTAYYDLWFGPSTTPGSAAWEFSLPVTPPSGGTGAAFILDNGAAFLLGTALIEGGVAKVIANNFGDYIGPSVPMSWVHGDRLKFSVSYAY